MPPAGRIKPAVVDGKEILIYGNQLSSNIPARDAVMTRAATSIKLTSGKLDEIGIETILLMYCLSHITANLYDRNEKLALRWHIYKQPVAGYGFPHKTYNSVPKNSYLNDHPTSSHGLPGDWISIAGTTLSVNSSHTGLTPQGNVFNTPQVNTWDFSDTGNRARPRRAPDYNFTPTRNGPTFSRTSAGLGNVDLTSTPPAYGANRNVTSAPRAGGGHQRSTSWAAIASSPPALSREEVLRRQDAVRRIAEGPGGNYR